MTDLIDCCLFRLGGLSADDPAAVDPGCFLFTFFDFLIEGRPFLRRQVVDRQEAQIGQSVCFLHIAVVSESRRFDVVQHLFRIAGSIASRLSLSCSEKRSAKSSVVVL